ncbi:aminoglycoside phosphotransferase family protein [Kutzneria viridogrisea]|uniref:Aminoglycoside phosphotransferase domain-containing protein n=1 Tax=Kutzneria viridogrisea TaxID=47990 RepID=A0ABR6BYU6_9PSEU|nr:hypothetical protein [Kutzneria viridogrisea]
MHGTASSNRQTALPTAATAQETLAAACARAGLDHTNAHTLKSWGNPVFLLRRDNVVAKVHLHPGLRHEADTAVRAAQVLAAHDIPAVRLAETAAVQPVRTGRYAVTFWQHVPNCGWPVRRGELARLLRRLHEVPASPELTDWDPITALRHQIDEAVGLDADHLGWLLARCDEAEQRLARLRYHLPRTVIHGDAHPTNLIPGPANTVLCDLDTTCNGPAEWDLVPTAVAALRFPGGIAAHRELADFYGYDVTDWEGFEVLRLVRELTLATFAFTHVPQSPEVRDQSRLRLRTLRSGDKVSWWTPYQ